MDLQKLGYYQRSFDNPPGIFVWPPPQIQAFLAGKTGQDVCGGGQIKIPDIPSKNQNFFKFENFEKISN